MPSNTGLSTDDGEPADWLPAALNKGWTYRDRIGPAAAGLSALEYYATLHPHSDRQEWAGRLQAGEITRNGQRLEADQRLAAGDRLAWRRPPWREPAVPAAWRLVYDDGDLHVIDKPAGLPVLPAGGFLDHTLLRMLERAGVPPPRPVHRLGRFTTGLLVCARQASTRAWLSAQLREGSSSDFPSGCRKVYRALVVPGIVAGAIGESRLLTIPIGRRPHPLLGRIWAAADDGLPARSTLTLIERRADADLVEVEIATGRPHQIRIHCAALGAPLLGDPLYLPGGGVRTTVLPGEGGYRLHAHRLALRRPDGSSLLLEAEAPAPLLPSGKA
jgi:23S rRNA pseudouridine1911/1915/1917 synthase